MANHVLMIPFNENELPKIWFDVYIRLQFLYPWLNCRKVLEKKVFRSCTARSITAINFRTWIRRWQLLDAGNVKQLHKSLVWNSSFISCKPLVLIKNRSKTPVLIFPKASHKTTSPVLWDTIDTYVRLRNQEIMQLRDGLYKYLSSFAVN